jgi:hypothetical protein
MSCINFKICLFLYHFKKEMGSVLVSSVVDHGFEPWSGKTKDNKIDI